MVEAIAQLVHRDYSAIVDTFVTLEFIPPGTDLNPILPVLAKVIGNSLFAQSQRWILHGNTFRTHVKRTVV